MSRVLKISAIALCALTLSGCAFTHDVLQAAYDEKAHKDRRHIPYPSIKAPSYGNNHSDDFLCVRISNCDKFKSKDLGNTADGNN